MIRKFLFVLFLFNTFIVGQELELKSKTMRIDITQGLVTDTVAPTLTVELPRPNIIESLPIYSTKKSISLRGSVYDNKEGVKVYANNVNLPLMGNVFSGNYPLKRGINSLKIKAVDRRKNVTSNELLIMFDPNADVVPPKIEFSGSSQIRGLKIVKEIENSESLVLEGHIIDESSIISFRVNNSKYYLDSSNSFYVDLTSKPDSLSIEAIDKYGNQTVLKRSLTYENKQLITGLEGSKYFALLIGVQDYIDKEINNLTYPISDVDKLKNTLIDKYTFIDSNVIVLQNPKRETILEVLSNLEARLTENDNLLIFYAGHGYWNDRIEQGYWLPSDARRANVAQWISNSDIRDYIKGIKTRHTLLIADACFSGGIFKTRSAFSDAPTAINELYKYPSRKAITSGALKAVPDKSEFVKYLLKRLNDNEDKFLSAQTLFVRFRDAVINTGKQSPQYGTIQGAGDEGWGDFIFIRK